RDVVVNILNDDGPAGIHAGETVTQTIGLSGTTIFIIEDGGRLEVAGAAQFDFGGVFDITIKNSGFFGPDVLVQSGGATTRRAAGKQAMASDVLSSTTKKPASSRRNSIPMASSALSRRP